MYGFLCIHAAVRATQMPLCIHEMLRCCMKRAYTLVKLLLHVRVGGNIAAGLRSCILLFTASCIIQVSLCIAAQGPFWMAVKQGANLY